MGTVISPRATGRGVLLLAALAAACGAPHASPTAPSRARARESVDVSEAPALEGDVVGPDGERVAGALVSAWSHFALDTRDEAHDVASSAEGRFRFASMRPGRYAVTATATGLAAAYSGVIVVRENTTPIHVVLRLGRGGATIEGTVRDEHGEPAAGARIVAPAETENEDEVYVTRADARGRYALTLPLLRDGDGFFVVADAPPHPRAYVRIDAGPHVVDLALRPPPAPRPADDVIEAWLRARATALDPSAGLDPAAARAFAAIAGAAPLVAMGEATHGSAEFPEWRRRAFEALVEQGFTVYAAEIGLPDALALDDYVVSGRGDMLAAIRALHTWKDETTETVALVTWMRAYNSLPSHARKVHFAGYDVYTPGAVPRIASYLARVDAAAARDAREALAIFANVGCDATYPALPEATRAATRRALDALLARFDARHAAYAARSGEGEWARARQLVRVVQEAELSYRTPAARDAQMAENVGWLVRQSGGARVMLDGHNTHVSAATVGTSEMGERLRKEWGAGYVAVGFAFGAGSFVALDGRDGKRSNDLVTFDLPRAPADTLDGALALGRMPAFVVDLRTAEAPVAAWLGSTQRVHSVGGFFDGTDPFTELAPARSFDAIVYVDRVSAIHRLPRLR
jgi:erythromycin esterase